MGRARRGRRGAHPGGAGLAGTRRRPCGFEAGRAGLGQQQLGWGQAGVNRPGRAGLVSWVRS